MKLKTKIENLLFHWENHGTTPPYASSKDLTKQILSAVKEYVEEEIISELEKKANYRRGNMPDLDPRQTYFSQGYDYAQEQFSNDIKRQLKKLEELKEDR